jgi:hypothetical protein
VLVLGLSSQLCLGTQRCRPRFSEREPEAADVCEGWRPVRDLLEVQPGIVSLTHEVHSVADLEKTLFLVETKQTRPPVRQMTLAFELECKVGHHPDSHPQTNHLYQILGKMVLPTDS